MKRRIVILLTSVLLLNMAGYSLQPPETDPAINSENIHYDASTPNPSSTTQINTSPARNTLTILGIDVSNEVRPYLPSIGIISVNRSNTGLLEAEEIVPRLLSGDDSFDVYTLSSKSSYAYSIIKKGFYQDLGQYPQLNIYYDNMYPMLTQASTYNDERFGMPISFMSNGLFFYYESDLKKINWDYNQLNSLDDLFHFIESWNQTDSQKEPIAIISDTIMNQIIFRYIYNHYDYSQHALQLDCHSFKDTLESAKRINNTEYVYDYSEILGYDKIVFKNTILPISPNAQYSTVPQVDGQNDINTASALWMIINPYSNNDDLVVEMLGTLAETNKLKSNYPRLYNNREFYFACTLDIEEIHKKVHSLTPEYFDSVNQVYQQHQVFFAIPGEEQLREIFTAYLDGNLSMDEAIVQAQQIIDLVSKEQQVAN